jgi:dynactin complex subunit
LAAEIERWQAVASQGIAIEREIRIEIERLRAERDDLMKANALLHALIGNREAEIERLRAALKQITSGGLGLFGSKEVARAALDKIDAALEQKSP